MLYWWVALYRMQAHVYLTLFVIPTIDETTFLKWHTREIKGVPNIPGW